MRFGTVPANQKAAHEFSIFKNQPRRSCRWLGFKILRYRIFAGKNQVARNGRRRLSLHVILEEEKSDYAKYSSETTLKKIKARSENMSESLRGRSDGADGAMAVGWRRMETTEGGLICRRRRGAQHKTQIAST